MDVFKLKCEIARKGYKVEEFCKICNMSKSSLYRRYKNPSLFTYGEMMQISKVLELNPAHLFFGIKVS